ncbi:hypothetical protein BGX24_002484 [Mortierella sp. AD032]|nr:hypothetical protein BGX24_002484 [Mortierella sp. AD032]
MAHNHRTLAQLLSSGSLNSNNNDNHKDYIFLVSDVHCYSTESFFDNNTTPALVNHHEQQQQPFFQQAAAASYNSNNNGYEDENHDMATFEDRFSVMEISASLAWPQDPHQVQHLHQQPQPPYGEASPSVATNSFVMVADTSSATAFYTDTPMDPGHYHLASGSTCVSDTVMVLADRQQH